MDEYNRLQELQELSDKFIDEQLKNEKLQTDLNEMKKSFEEKCEIVSILRQQIADITSGLEDLETSHETLKSQNDNLKAKITTLEGENKSLVESLAEHVSKVDRLNNENENLTQRMESRTKQTSDLAMQLMEVKVELEEKTNELETLRKTLAENQKKLPIENEELTEEIHSLRTKNRALTNQLKQMMLEQKRLVVKQPVQVEEKEEPCQEIYNLRAQIKTLRHQLSEFSRNEDLEKLKGELHIMETSFNMERAHKDRYLKENIKLERSLAEINKLMAQLREENHELREKATSKRLPVSNLPIADEVGEIMASSTLPSQKKRPMYDPSERVNELARRNKLQKPLHQSSYALELDTFNKMDISDDEIKRGNLKQRSALADHSNHRKVAAKPMAFTINF